MTHLSPSVLDLLCAYARREVLVGDASHNIESVPLGELAPDAFAALKAVLDLHRPEPGPDEDGAPVCWKCRGRGEDWPDAWPCATVRAITDHLAAEVEAGSGCQG